MHSEENISNRTRKFLDLLKRLFTFLKKILHRKTKHKSPQNKKPQTDAKPVHPWRECPSGQYWVRTHPMKGTKGRRGHCRTNPSKKDQIYEAEIELIEVLKPSDPLDPNLVKALIATESSFYTTKQNHAGQRAGQARGLMQVTDWTLEILKDEQGELRDHFVNVNQNDMLNANLNIAAGIRWLFRKKETASAKLGHTASWIWAAADYKSYLKDFQKNPNHKQMNNFINLYNALKGIK